LQQFSRIEIRLKRKSLDFHDFDSPLTTSFTMHCTPDFTTRALAYGLFNVVKVCAQYTLISTRRVSIRLTKVTLTLKLLFVSQHFDTVAPPRRAWRFMLTCVDLLEHVRDATCCSEQLSVAGLVIR
jgi:hypothetical protein